MEMTLKIIGNGYQGIVERIETIFEERADIYNASLERFQNEFIRQLVAGEAYLPRDIAKRLKQTEMEFDLVEGLKIICNAYEKGYILKNEIITELYPIITEIKHIFIILGNKRLRNLFYQ